MGTWEEFKLAIHRWVRLEISDQEFYCYLVDTEFEHPADRRLANIFIMQHDGGEWSHAIHHRMR